VESAIAAALLPSAPRVMRVAWDEIRGSVAATAAAVFERGAAIAARAPALPPSIPQIAAALASHEAISRVAATVALARHRDELAVEVETWAESVVARTPAQAAWALAVGRALDDPTLGPSLARLEAAAR
ncbi:MAG TPA: hypothetical protein VKE69_13130, partial [Planctomycetota bacterium]|nr:hypothetical protein [Planctomycetota bacterium]